MINGVETTLDEFRGTPYIQFDMRVSRPFTIHERWSVMPFVEFFNLFNRNNPGAFYITNIAALPTPVNNLANATAFCLNPSCTQTRADHQPESIALSRRRVGRFLWSRHNRGHTVRGAVGHQIVVLSFAREERREEAYACSQNRDGFCIWKVRQSLLLALYFYHAGHYHWWLFAALFLVSGHIHDRAIVKDAKWGSAIYNLVHTLTGPLLLLGGGASACRGRSAFLTR